MQKLMAKVNANEGLISDLQTQINKVVLAKILKLKVNLKVDI